MSAATSVAIMGGAFDPVHVGHLRAALELRAAGEFAELRFVPSANPPHRAPHVAPPELRVAMLTAALDGLEGCCVDGRELDREGPSYTVLTLRELRAELADRSLSMLVGMDAFLGLPGWQDWEQLLELAHIVVAQRPGWQPPTDGPLGALLAERRCHTAAELHAGPAGNILVQAVTQLEISSSAIRELLARGEDARYLLPPAALELARTAACYAGPSDPHVQEHSAHA